MKKTFLLFLPLLLLSCGGEKAGAQSGTETKDTAQKTTVDTAQAEEAYEQPIAVEIGRKKLHPGVLRLPAPFVEDSALHKIFPGKYTKVTDDMDDEHQVVWWKCTGCKSEPLYYNYFLEPELESYFPDSSFNTSLSLGHDEIELDGKKALLFYFYHTNGYYPDFTGRFTGCPTGMALFMKEGSEYVLRDFNAALGTYGSFRTPIRPKIITTANGKLLIDLTYGNGGAGAEYTSIKEIFVAENGTFRKVFSDRFLDCFNTCMGEWSHVVEPLEKSTANGPVDLQIVTAGTVDGSCVDDDNIHYFEVAPKELMEKVASIKGKKEKIEFRVERVFRYTGNEYKCVESKTEIK